MNENRWVKVSAAVLMAVISNVKSGEIANTLQKLDLDEPLKFAQSVCRAGQGKKRDFKPKQKAKEKSPPQSA